LSSNVDLDLFAGKIKSAMNECKELLETNGTITTHTFDTWLEQQNES
jgi:hypothetical protein